VEADRRAVRNAAWRERQAGKEAQRLRVFQMLEIFYERWPALFKMLGPRLPMSVGIHKDIIAAAPDLHAGVVRKAIRYYALSGSYTQAVVAGALRYNLYGQPAGVVTETEARWTVVKIR
jgi:ProP effector